MSARITTAQLAARMDASEASTAEALLRLTEAVTGLVAQFATPTAVAEITSAPSVRKANKSAKARKSAKATAPKAATTAKSTSEWVAEKGALSPVNKALAAAKLDGAWADRWLNEQAVKAALASLTVAQRKAALPYVQARMAKAIERKSA